MDNSFSHGVYPNPIFGISEGEMKREKLKQDYKYFIRISRDNSVEKERSHSRSRLLKLKEAELERDENESFAYLM